MFRVREAGQGRAREGKAREGRSGQVRAVITRHQHFLINISVIIGMEDS